MSEEKVDRLIAKPGEIPVDITARLFLDGRKFGPVDKERTILDCLMDLSRAIREGDGMIKSAVIKSYVFLPNEKS